MGIPDTLQLGARRRCIPRIIGSALGALSALGAPAFAAHCDVDNAVVHEGTFHDIEIIETTDRDGDGYVSSFSIRVVGDSRQSQPRRKGKQLARDLYEAISPFGGALAPKKGCFDLVPGFDLTLVTDAGSHRFGPYHYAPPEQYPGPGEARDDYEIYAGPVDIEETDGTRYHSIPADRTGPNEDRLVVLEPEGIISPASVTGGVDRKARITAVKADVCWRPVAHGSANLSFGEGSRKCLPPDTDLFKAVAERYAGISSYRHEIPGGLAVEAPELDQTRTIAIRSEPAGATIRVQNRELGTTDWQGEVPIDWLAEQAMVELSKAGYATRRIQLPEPDGGDSMSVDLYPTERQVTGQVTAAGDESVTIHGVELRFEPRGNAPIRTASTDIEGRYEVALAPGRYQVELNHPLYHDAETAIRIEKTGGNTTFDHQLGFDEDAAETMDEQAMPAASDRPLPGTDTEGALMPDPLDDIDVGTRGDGSGDQPEKSDGQQAGEERGESGADDGDRQGDGPSSTGLGTTGIDGIDGLTRPKGPAPDDEASRDEADDGASEGAQNDGTKEVGPTSVGPELGVTTPVVSDRDAMPAQPTTGFAGTWSSDFGELRLHRAGDFIVGDYADEGVLAARVAGACMAGVFTNGDRAGHVRFRRTGEGLAGAWAWHGKSPEQSWSAERTGDPPARLRRFTPAGGSIAVASDAPQFEGAYRSDTLTFDLVAQDGFLIGDHGDSGIVAGIWDGEAFVGRFTENGRAGWFELPYDPDGTAFGRGAWGWVGEDEAGEWSLSPRGSERPELDNFTAEVDC